jgi:hypothetical protein
MMRVSPVAKLNKVAIMRIGKVLQFADPDRDKGMENPNINMLRALRDKNPDIQFDYISKARISKEQMETEWSGNLRYSYEEYINLDENGVFTGWDDEKRKRVHAIAEAADAIFIIGGPCTDTPNPILKQPEDIRGKALPRFWRYWTPNADTLEYHQHKPWVWTYMDPRNPLMCRDFTKTPDIALGFKDGDTLSLKSGYAHDKSEKMLEFKTEFGYMEFLGTYEYALPPKDGPIKDKADFFTITQHELTSWRSKQFTKLIDPLPWGPDQLKIYGEWKKKENDPRYLGPIKGAELYQRTLSEGKYGFALPIHPGWATPKLFHFWRNDVVFFTDHNMDSDGHYIPKNHFTRVETAAELHLKIQAVEDNPDLYKQLVMWQRGLLHKYSGGEQFNNLVLSRLQQVIDGI